AEVGLDVRCRRGLLAVRVRPEQVRQLANVCGRGPWLETLCLERAGPADLREVLVNGWLAPFTRLALLRGTSGDGLCAEQAGAAALAALAHAPLLGRLEWLSLARSNLAQAGAEALAALPAPLRLRGLSIANCARLGRQLVARLLAAPLLGSVTHLNVEGCP